MLKPIQAKYGNYAESIEIVRAHATIQHKNLDKTFLTRIPIISEQEFNSRVQDMNWVQAN